MAEFAFRCRPCDGRPVSWYVARDHVARMPADTHIVRVKVGNDWLCARLDRSRTEVVEGLLLREAVASDEQDCPECADVAEPADEPQSTSSPSAPVKTPEAEPSSAAPVRKILAAAISISGERMFVVAARMELVRSAPEADMAIDELSPKLGGIPVVLMAQREEDGAPSYYGDSRLVDLLAGVPLEKMPWKEYSLH